MLFGVAFDILMITECSKKISILTGCIYHLLKLQCLDPHSLVQFSDCCVMLPGQPSSPVGVTGLSHDLVRMRDEGEYVQSPVQLLQADQDPHPSANKMLFQGFYHYYL